MWFNHPNPAKLAAANDLRGLVNCVTGKDAAVARQAVPILAALVDDLDGAPGTHDTIRDLESDAGPMAVEALVAVLRHDLARDTHVKAAAALGLYHLHRADLVQKVLAEIGESSYKGQALHGTLSRTLLGAAVRGKDVAMVEFLLANGHFADDSQVAAARDLLRSSGASGGTAAAAVTPSA